jgi:formylmethanofuran dehydrogenase subunit E
MARRHIHKYHKIKLNNDDIWACALPDCNHFMPKHYEQMVLGKSSYCWNCDKPFILNQENMKDDKPICESCSMGGSKSLESALEALINSKK